MEEYLEIAGKRFRSRLLVVTGKYRTPEEMVAALEASGAEIVTVAIRRLDLDKPDQKTLLDYIDWSRYTILPNTAACRTVEEALFTARLEGAYRVGQQVFGVGDHLQLDPVGAGDLPAEAGGEERFLHRPAGGRVWAEWGTAAVS